MAAARRRKFDVVLWKIDRFGRSLRKFIDNVLTPDRAGVRFVALTPSMDTDKRNPMNNLAPALRSRPGSHGEFQPGSVE